ncbi:hypothetical protein P775_26215 [Puniceibacterium antarcticum]|uniref:YncI copper-binding domain-containing protein n=1 Tax=Puniceibacterium antarcticum TaxID=1206336 RepID=A0A2G8R1A2_9RHOB|nr:DUF1775 domain-containing protein [Puniceibacterium antarcticum]PIL14928.1 hypothetical protein P775_26215 [Puniceibacterium antarcticum]
MKYLNTTMIALFELGILVSTAQAQPTIEQAKAAVGATTKITLRDPHRCEGEARNDVRIDIPEGFYAHKPMPKPG